VGYRDMGDDEGRAARLYVEAVSLLSVEEDAADLFSVFHYSILQAGSRQFDILVPKGFNVVSADGAGGFRYTTETTADGTVLHGETVFPIRDQYEVSLRLTQPHDRGALAVSPPRTLGAERESGWLGLEVLDTVQVSETARTEAVAVDVTQLPEELLQSAVSPVLQGWRYHTAGASVVLDATPLPEREPSTGSIDQVEATTRISAEGRAQTRLRVTLRNRLRHSLALRLAEGVELTAAHIDGKPVVPSAGADGAVMLPLRRSAGGSRPVPFTLELEVEGEVGGFGVLGVRDLELPAFGLPISTLRWTVEGPAHSRYTRLYGEVEPQDGTTLDATTDGDRRTLRHSRYWIAANKPVGVTFGWVRGWLVAPLEAVGVLLALGLLWRKRSRWGGDRLVVGLRGAWARVRSTSEVAPAPGGWRAMGLARRGVLVVGTLAASGMLVLLGLRVLWVLSNPWG
jgi:hypothetical protein